MLYQMAAPKVMVAGLQRRMPAWSELYPYSLLNFEKLNSENP